MEGQSPENMKIPERPLFLCVLANTETAYIEGLSAAGKTAKLTDYTPSGDAEVLETGMVVDIPILPMTPPYDTPTPALITRVALDMTGVPHMLINAGLKILPAKTIPLKDIGGSPGKDIREPIAVPEAQGIFERGFSLGRDLREKYDLFVIGESIPAGTTTASAVLVALGYDGSVSSSAFTNPLELKKQVVNEALRSSCIEPGDLRSNPMEAIRLVGDPMMAAVVGITAGLGDVPVVLAGGTQMITIFGLIKHLGYKTDNITIVTTCYVMNDTSAHFARLAKELGAKTYATDPGFGQSRLQGLRQYEAGFVKEGVGAGGAIYLAQMYGIPMEKLRAEIELLSEKLSKYGDINRVK
ncbi:MAG: TIGR00303 family protein [Methanomethylovorans sp.]|uniref:nicotinate mononucleotide-dependent phosphoribosyltransferase CobT n=1 Tax=Methanomethylovorans sp. TaxID=2758717 RepID=UPI003C707A98